MLVLQSVQYRRKAVVRVLVEEETKYHEIDRMFVIDDTKVFVLAEMETEFHHHLMAHRVTRTDKTVVCLYSSFARPGVLHLKTKSGSKYIVEKDSADTEWC